MFYTSSFSIILIILGGGRIPRGSLRRWPGVTQPVSLLCHFFFDALFSPLFFDSFFVPILGPFWVPKTPHFGSFWAPIFALCFELQFLVFQLRFFSLSAFYRNVKCVFFLGFFYYFRLRAFSLCLALVPAFGV